MTTVSEAKKVPNPPKTCIFCGGRPICREHIYAAWMGKYMPADEFGTSHLVITPTLDEHGQPVSIAVGAGPMQLAGAHRSRRLPVVCEPCNNGWMSVLQNTAKPAMTPMLEGLRYSPERAQQRAISAWAAMFTMVYEAGHPPTATIPIAERAKFMRERKPSRNWHIWVARFDGIRHLGSTHHRALHLKPPHVGTKIAHHPNAQLTVGAVGHLFFLTFWTSDERVMDRFGRALRDSMHAARLLRVHPPVGFHMPPPASIDDLDMDRFVDVVTLILQKA